MSDEDWERRIERFDRHPVRTTVWWSVVAIVLIGAIGAGLWAFGVFASPIKGQGDAYRQKNSAQNWTNAQAQFHQDYESILAFDKKIGTAQQDLNDFDTTHPNIGNGTAYDPLAEQRDNLKRTLTGLTQQCRDTVANYNARAQSYLSQDFRDASLPERIADSDNSVDCKATPDELSPSATR